MSHCSSPRSRTVIGHERQAGTGPGMRSAAQVVREVSSREVLVADRAQEAFDRVRAYGGVQGVGTRGVWAPVVLGARDSHARRPVVPHDPSADRGHGVDKRTYFVAFGGVDRPDETAWKASHQTLCLLRLSYSITTPTGPKHSVLTPCGSPNAVSRGTEMSDGAAVNPSPEAVPAAITSARSSESTRPIR